MTQFTVALGNSRCSTRVACGGGESRAHCLAADAERGWPALLRAGLCPGLSPKEQVCLVVTGEREGVGKLLRQQSPRHQLRPSLCGFGMCSIPVQHTPCLNGSRQILFDSGGSYNAAVVGRGLFTADHAGEVA